MKLFKISFISIISILIFQSQLYGINLNCYFKLKLNNKEFNGINCDVDNTPSVCKKQFGEEYEYQDWFSEVIIRDKDVVIIKEPMEFNRSSWTNKKIRSWKKENKKISKVGSIFHHTYKSKYTKLIQDSYIIVFDSESDLFSLYFDNISKKSTLVVNHSLNKEINEHLDSHTIFSKTYFGECEIE